MSDLVKYIYRAILPESIRYKILRRKEAGLYEKIKKDILKYYSTLAPSEIAPEIAEALTYLKENPIHVFPYNFNSLFNPSNINVLFDTFNGLNYVMHEGKKLYFKKGKTAQEVRDNYFFLLLEQHIDSPHRYITNDFFIDVNSVVADAGAAEGIFALAAIENIKHLYLFETDPDWVFALNETYRPWKEKVTIVNKFVSDKDDEKHISLDNYFSEFTKFNFLKIDVDGAEELLFRGADKILSGNDKIKLVVCTYHKQGDEKQFAELLQSKKFSLQTSKKFMLFYFDDNFKEPYFRRGLIRAVR